MASEASYVYILSWQKLIKNNKLVENTKIQKLKWDILADFQTIWEWDSLFP